MFNSILLARINKTQGNEVTQCGWIEEIPDILTYQWDRYLVTMGYFFKKGPDDIKHFLTESKYKNISKQINGILYYVGHETGNRWLAKFI